MIRREIMGLGALCIICSVVTVLQSSLSSPFLSLLEPAPPYSITRNPSRFEWCNKTAAKTSSEPNALPLSYENLRTIPTGLLGDLRNDLTCVCGCQNSNTIKHTTVYCSFDNRDNTVRWCVFHDPLFYASDWQQNSDTNNKKNKRPLLVAVCQEQSEYRGLLGHDSKNKWWKGHKNFGIDAFSHVKVHRIAPFWDNDSCQGSSCHVPKSLVWGGTKEHAQTNGWAPVTHNRSQWVDWNAIGRAPQSRAPLAYWDSSDCAMKFDNKQVPSINPWHCKAAWVNYLLLSGLLERYPQRLLNRPTFDRNAVQLFSLAGAYHFFDYGNNMSGWYEMLSGAARGGGYDTSFRSADQTTVQLQGRFDLVVPNLIPASSLLWGYLLVKKGESSSGMHSEVMDDMRNNVKEGLVPDLLAHPTHPIRRLISDFSDHVRLILPKDAVKQQVALKALEMDYGHWEDNEIAWKPTVLDRLTLLLRRHSFASAKCNGNDVTDCFATVEPSACKRCLTNVEELAHILADSLSLTVVLIHPTVAVPEQLQDYLFLAAQSVVGMHGGAWGSAWMLGLQQGAVEVTPTSTGANARHIVTAGGGAYDSSMCVDCATQKSLSGRANISDVVHKTKEVLCHISSFSDV